MENIKVVLLPNTLAATTMDTIQDFKNAQDEVNEPMVLFMDTNSKKTIKHYRVKANNMDHLMKMYRLRVFETPDLPENTHEKYCSAYFMGIGSSEEEEINLDLASLNSIKAIETIAKRRLRAIEDACEVYESPDCKKVSAVFSQQYQQIKQCLHNEEQLKMLLEFDTRAYDMTAMYGDSMFIQGFYEGIKFMQHALEAGLKKVDETKKSHSAGNTVTFGN